MGYRNTVKRCIKFFPIFLVLIFGFIMRCELFHIQMGNFAYASFLSSTADVSEDKYDRFITDVKKAADNEDISFFVIYEKTESELKHTVNIFTYKDAQKDLAKKTGLYERTYKSLINGETKVYFKDIDEMTYEDYIAAGRICFSGDTHSIDNVCNTLSKSFTIGSPRYTETTEKDMILIVWGIMAALPIVFNGVYILSKRKEVSLRMIFGEDLRIIVLKEIIMDAVGYSLAYFAAGLFTSLFISGDYMPLLSGGLYFAGILISLLLYLSFFSYDAKNAFASNYARKDILGAMYFFRALVFAFTLFALATNVSELKSVWSGGINDDTAAVYNDCYYLSVRSQKNLESLDTDAINELYLLQDEVYDALYYDANDDIEPITAMQVVSYRGGSCILLSSAASPLISSLSDYIDENVDITVLSPDSTSDASLATDYVLGAYVNTAGRAITFTTYKGEVNVPFFSNDTGAGFDTAANPVIIYCKDDAAIIPGNTIEGHSTLFKISGNALVNFSDKYALNEAGLKIVATNVGERYTYQRSFILRLVRFLSSLCIMVTVLCLVTLLNISIMEHRVFGISYALKKVLGYSYIQRNMRMLAGFLVPDILTALIVSVTGYFSNAFSPLYSALCAACLIAAELVIHLIFNLHMETLSIGKILKGGCL